MNILSLFVLIPLLMLLGLWIARNLNQVRGVMVAGSTLLLILSAYLTVSYIGLRNAGATDEMLFTDSISWYAYLLFGRRRRYFSCNASVECHYRIYRNICILEAPAAY